MKTFQIFGQYRICIFYLRQFEGSPFAFKLPPNILLDTNVIRVLWCTWTVNYETRLFRSIGIKGRFQNTESTNESRLVQASSNIGEFPKVMLNSS